MRTCEFKSQIDGIKVVHSLFNQRKHMKVLDRMNLVILKSWVYLVMSREMLGKKDAV